MHRHDRIIADQGAHAMNGIGAPRDRSSVIRAGVTAGLVGLLVVITGIPCSVAWADTLIPMTSTWKYHDTGVDLGAAWRATSYDDSTWSSGPAILGYGETWITTVLSYGPDPLHKYITTYFRTAFECGANPELYTTLLLRANYDDGFVAYLNGVEVARRSLPAGVITFGTLAASHEGGAYESIDLSATIGLLQAGDNVLAVETHQAAPSSSDLVMAMALEAWPPPAVTRGPYLQMGSSTGITVRWRTDQATTSCVRFGPAPGSLTSNVCSSDVVTEHEIRINGLAPDTRYYYSVGTSTAPLAGDDSAHFAVTSPLAGGSRRVRVWAIGDSGEPGPDQDAVRDAYVAHTGGAPTDVWVMLGDNAYTAGTDTEYQAAVFDAYPAMLRNAVLWPTRGNHDLLYTGVSNDYYDVFSMPQAGEAGGLASGTEAYYSFDCGDIHFICLDSYGSSRASGSAMMTWLAADLAATARDWVIAFWHHPPYSRGSHDSDLETPLIEMRENALPILEAGGVDLVLCGHSHSYERSMLLDEHYGLSSTLVDSMKLDAGDGSVSGDGPYVKAAAGTSPHEGAVYAVAGSSSKISGGPLDHPVMIRALNLLGSLVIDVEDGQLDAVFIDDQGQARDDFTIVKGARTSVSGRAGDDGSAPAVGAPAAAAPGEPRLVAEPNPFPRATRLSFTAGQGGRVQLDIFDAAGRRMTTLVDAVRSPGRHEVTWTGRDDAGRAVPAGLYFARLTADGISVTSKVLLLQ